MSIRINDEKIEGQEIEKNREVRSVGSIAGVGDYSNKKKHNSSVGESKRALNLIGLTSTLDIRSSSSKVWRVCTAYKWKADKIRPLAPGKSDESKPEDLDNWVDVCLNKYYSEEKYITFNCEFDDYIRPRITPFPVGEQLTNERIKKLQIGFKLTSQKKEFFILVLYKCEGVLAWSFKDLYDIHSEYLPPQVIQTELHKIWQTKTY
ncbi:uncharacterized protein CIMG_13499 [Coccidioides immitis RS]|uniref:Uncharacterized protein n=1 Tax=Coccidioides immitis (strain RS) TaxID=246410 RepID=A0A0E1RVH9_COCIM|nr:uncharacterized protein CIMG_13499 [Coccidioides immitis RS]EAS27301.2 hypothetical protein CIMG_13499 [Coccidioides immitis RS]